MKEENTNVLENKTSAKTAVSDALGNNDILLGIAPYLDCWELGAIGTIEQILELKKMSEAQEKLKAAVDKRGEAQARLDRIEKERSSILGSLEKATAELKKENIALELKMQQDAMVAAHRGA